jgi:manganese/iron transport system substrate-binding protein
MIRKFALTIILAGIFALSACSGASKPGPATRGSPEALKPVSLAAGEKLQVVATTSIVADLVANVGGEKIALKTLLPLGTDPHAFEPAPRDAVTLAGAHVIFANGAGLEEVLAPLIQSAKTKAPLVELSEGVALRTLPEGEGGEHEHGGVDPHTWTTPANAVIFVANIERALSALDPANASTYKANAAAYTAKLQELDAWVRAQIETIPPEHRKLVTDHEAFGYYAERYGLENVGAVIPSFSTLAEPSAQQMAALQETIRREGVKAIFVDASANPTLAQRVANDMGIKVVRLYSGSLGAKGSGAETYLDYIRFNTTAIVEALR